MDSKKQPVGRRETSGNTIKMTIWDLFKEKRKCVKKHPPCPKKTGEKPPNGDLLTLD
jgi:hypothetical protein